MAKGRQNSSRHIYMERKLAPQLVLLSDLVTALSLLLLIIVLVGWPPTTDVSFMLNVRNAAENQRWTA